ncbi:MAG: hypothetical protein ALECFALPRED_009926 [Alectoria fallacina]|uniref:Transmembrane protein 69 n=1 Tax=Alectoria fallacina TaxID=1903189 RepID=A0A8H3PJV0_9LECA|nr:MAG: hypothetical protein ALECFALPRED_009926 [Alectoria fallacina]
MLRYGVAASLSRTSLRYVSSNSARTTSNLAHVSILRRKAAGFIGAESRVPLALVPHKPFNTSLQRYATHPGNPFDKIDKKHEELVEHQKIEPHPEEVSASSSVHQVFGEKGIEESEEKDVDMLAGVKADFKVIKDTFALNEVPREALVIGMAGVLPYLATSLSTVYLAFDINHASETGSGFLFSPHVAEQLLHIIEPLQVGYGAVILSFLGAIHWGLEWAKYGGVHGYPRYAYGVIAPAVAWPTILLPIEYALISQFCAFTFLYFADARAVVRGWAPHWYSTYRFVLTFIVGASIVASLIGRGQIADQINKLPSPADRVKALRDMQLDAMEVEEREKRARIAAEDEEEDDEGGDDEEE